MALYEYLSADWIWRSCLSLKHNAPELAYRRLEKARQQTKKVRVHFATAGRSRASFELYNWLRDCSRGKCNFRVGRVLLVFVVVVVAVAVAVVIAVVVIVGVVVIVVGVVLLVPVHFVHCPWHTWETTGQGQAEIVLCGLRSGSREKTCHIAKQLSSQACLC